LRALFPLELLAFALVFWGDAAGHVPVSKTPFLLLVAWASLRARGLTWRPVGLSFDANWRRMAMIGCLAGVAFWAFEYFVENPVIHTITGRYPDLSEFSEVVGNLPFLLALLALNIILAGFGEEMVWRGYALGRVAQLVGGGTGWLVSLVVVNLSFGLAHRYQGEAGVTQAAVQGVLLGILYLRTGRNLIAPICAHTVANTCDFLLIYAGRHVGTTGRFPF
jgi:membrane protease YdiL (CAAX protease family)